MRRRTSTFCLMVITIGLLAAGCDAQAPATPPPQPLPVASFPNTLDQSCRDGRARLFDECGSQVGLFHFQIRLRLAGALERLSEGAEDIAALALDCGFSSHSQFSEAFRKVFGKSPRTVRRQLRTSNMLE
jgi:transcriptional regulator GlxA family with amidase domain